MFGTILSGEEEGVGVGWCLRGGGEDVWLGLEMGEGMDK